MCAWARGVCVRARAFTERACASEGARARVRVRVRVGRAHIMRTMLSLRRCTIGVGGPVWACGWVSLRVCLGAFACVRKCVCVCAHMLHALAPFRPPRLPPSSLPPSPPFPSLTHALRPSPLHPSPPSPSPPPRQLLGLAAASIATGDAWVVGRPLLSLAGPRRARCKADAAARQRRAGHALIGPSLVSQPPTAEQLTNDVA